MKSIVNTDDLQVEAAHWDDPVPTGEGGFDFLLCRVSVAAGKDLRLWNETVGSHPLENLRSLSFLNCKMERSPLSGCYFKD